jgi:UPF0716 protein FxsA
MPLVLLALLLGGAVLEVVVAVRVADLVGALPVVLLLLGSSLLGARVLSRRAIRAWRRVATAAQDGGPVGRRVADTGLLVLAGVLLLVPGLVTGALGLLLLLPPVRAVVRPVLGALVLRRFALPVVLGARGAGWAFDRARQGRPGAPADVEGRATDRPDRDGGPSAAPTVLPPRVEGDGTPRPHA